MAVYSKTKITNNSFVEEFEPQFNIAEIEKNTEIEISGIKNLSIDKITILSDSIFKRNISANNITKEIYNLRFNDLKYSDTILNMNGYKRDEDTIRLTIYNRDDLPLDISGIKVSYFADELIFKPDNSGVITLEFGIEADKPDYDIENYKNEILKQYIDTLELSDFEYSQLPAPVPEKDYTLYFNITITAVSLILIFIFILKLKKG